MFDFEKPSGSIEGVSRLHAGAIFGDRPAGCVE
jgi:hypothetical protein